MIDVHPDDLLDRARRGSLDRDGQARLDAHLAVCGACRVELQLASDFAGEADGEAGEDDQARLARIIEAATARVQLHAPPAEPVAPAAPRRSRRRGEVWLLVAATLVIGAFAWAKATHRDAAVPQPTPAPSATAIALPAIEAPRPVEPPAPTATQDVVAPSGPKEVAPAPTIAAPKPAPKVVTASELFAQANDARRTGDTDEAVRLYRTLQTHHAATAEATTSHVSLGRLLLDKKGDASGARAQFRAYLTTAPTGTLAEEARVGLALSAAALSDAAGERAAWEELLARHPDSVHAARARKRLAELGP